MNKKLESFFKRILDEEIYNAIKTDANFYFQKWQWEYIIQVALKIDTTAVITDKRIQDIYCAMNDKYGIEGNEPKDASDMQSYHKILNDLTIVENNLWLAPSRLVSSFALNESNVNHTRIMNFLALYDIPYNPPPPAEPLYKQLNETTVINHKQQTAFLKKVLGADIYDYMVKKDGCRVLSCKGLDLMLIIAGATSIQRELIGKIFGMRTEDNKEMKLFEAAGLLDIDPANFYRVQRRFCAPDVQDALIECLEGRNKNINSLIELAQKRAFKRNHHNLFNFYYKLTGREIYHELTRNELNLMLDVAQVKNDADKKIIREFLGVNYEREEKLCKDIQVKNESGEDLVENEVANRVKNILKSLLNINNMGGKIIEASIKGDSQFFKAVSFRTNHKKQLDIINKYAKTQNSKRIFIPLNEKQWDEILEAFQFSDKIKQVFKLFYGVKGEGEMTVAEIAAALNMTEKDAQHTYCLIINKLGRYREDLESLFTNYYANDSFDTSNLCRKKQKAFLVSVAHEVSRGRKVKKIQGVLTEAQWEEVFDRAGLSGKERVIVCYNLGIGHAREYEYREVCEKMNPPMLKSTIASTVIQTNMKIRKGDVKSLICKFINDNKL